MRGKIDGIWILPINSTIRRHNVVKLRHCVNQVMPIDVGNDDYIILCNFAGRIRSGFEIIEGVGAGWSSGSKKRLVLLGLCPQEALFSSANITDTF